MIETIILCTVFGAFILFAFIKGIELGQRLNRNERIEIKNPVAVTSEKLKEHKINKASAEEQEIMKINLENIDNYNGSSLGQKEIPR